MKNTIIKKALACMTSLMAVSALSVSMASYAVDTPTINTSPANKLETPASSVGIPINKDIVLFNVDGSPILSPNIIYSYEVTPAAIDTENPAKITTYSPDDLKEDGKTPKEGVVPITVTVKSGILAAITTVGDDSATTDKKETTITFGAADDTHTNNNVTKHATNREDATTITLTNRVRNSMTITVDANKIYDPDYDTVSDTHPKNVQVNGPGVYRYKIEDVTTADTLTASGIERKYKDTNNNHDKYVYLDVYTKYTYDNSEPKKVTGLEVYGYVLLKDVENNDNVSINYVNSTTETITETLKVTGFDTESENTETYDSTGNPTCAPGELTSDAYHTYNVEVSKKTDGDLADTQHNFPFKINLTNGDTYNAENTVTSLDDFYYVITKDGQKVVARNDALGNLENTEFNAALNSNGAWELDGINNANTNLQLQNGDKIVITGLPVNTKIKVIEKNDTDDTYSVSATNLKQTEGNDTDKLTLKCDSATGTSRGTSLSVASQNTAEMDTAFELKKTDKGDKIEFTNTLKDISVTGLLFNIAPFIFIVAAGAVLIALFMRNKKKDNSDNMI